MSLVRCPFLIGISISMNKILVIPDKFSRPASLQIYQISYWRRTIRKGQRTRDIKFLYDKQRSCNGIVIGLEFQHSIWYPLPKAILMPASITLITAYNSQYYHLIKTSKYDQNYSATRILQSIEICKFTKCIMYSVRLSGVIHE